MYPKRLILDDARSLGIAVLGLDVNASRRHLPGRAGRRRRPVPTTSTLRGSAADDAESRHRPDAALPAWRRARQPYGIRLSLADVKGISEAEVARIVAGQPYADLADFWTRARVSRPVVERLVLAGAFDCPARHRRGGGLGRRGRVTRRDLLLHVAELDRWERAGGAPPRRSRRPGVPSMRRPREVEAGGSARRPRAGGGAVAGGPRRSCRPPSSRPSSPSTSATGPELVAGTGLPEMTGPERVRAELDVLGLDARRHVVEFYAPLLRALGVTRSRDLLGTRSRSEVWVAGVKVATQTPPIRSGRRVVFLTLDDAHRPGRRTFFEDVQGPYAGVVFHSWLLLVRGVLRRTGDRGVSMRATGAWELAGAVGRLAARRAPGACAPRSRRGRPMPWPAPRRPRRPPAPRDARTGRRVLVHASGFRQSPYADIKPAGGRPPRGPRRSPVVPATPRPPAAALRASCGTPAPAAPDTRVVARRPTLHPTRPEEEPPWPTSVADPAAAGAQPGLRTVAV